MKEIVNRVLKLSPTILVIIGCLISLFVGKNISEHPKAEWDTTQDSILISQEFFILRHIDYNYIPDFQIWGDGYIVWVEHQSDGYRKVFHGNLTHDELEFLIESFIDAGFFNWFGNSNPDSYYDMISIQLLDRSHRKQFDANEKIFELVNFINSGAGTESVEFIPSTGYLYVLPVEDTDLPKDIQVQYHWSADKFGYDLDSVRNDKENGDFKIIGDDLLFAWEIINSPYAVVESNGKVYWIALTIPRIND